MMKFGTLGPAGTFSELALNQYLIDFNYKKSEIVLFHSIESVFAALKMNKVDKILVPVENTINGKVETTLDELLRLNSFCIEFELTTPISHCLLAYSDDVITSVSYILSHYQPLRQCQKYLLKYFPNASQVVTKSSALAAELLSEHQFEQKKIEVLPYACSAKNTVVVGNKSLASIYNLKILAKNINDITNNFTRFFVIGDQHAQITGNDKTSLIFTTSNNAGALYEILGVFADNSINLLSISSRPSKKKLGEYLFYVDVNGHKNEDVLNNVLLEVQDKALFYKLIGSYSLSGV